MKTANEQHPNWKPPEDFDFKKLEEIGFDDMSWGNDAMPCFGNYKTGFTLWVDYVEKDSEFMGQEVEFLRYHLSKRELAEGETEHECLHDDSEHVLSTDKFQEVLDHLKGKGELKTYEINYGDAGEPSKERFQAIAGGNLASMVKAYAEVNEYEIREIEGKGGAS